MFERPAFSESTEQGVQGSRAIASHQPEQNASRTADTDVRQVGRLRGSPVQSGAREAFPPRGKCGVGLLRNRRIG